MKKTALSFFILFFSFTGFAQLLSWTPEFPTESSSPLVITMDASKGNKGLLNYDPADVYVHIGVITNLSTASNDWKYVKTTWGTKDAAYKAVSLGNNKWSFTITGGLRSFFGITNASETIKKIAIIFRNGSGSQKQVNSDNSDMYIPVYTASLAVRFTNPPFQPTYKPVAEPITKIVGDYIALTAISNNAATLKLFLNGNEIASASSAKTISANPSLLTAGNQQVIAEANDGTSVTRDTLNFFVTGGVNTAALPAGVKQGINYDANNTSVTLVLYAPGKSRICVIGEFPGSNWAEQSAFQMNKTPDGNTWWIKITGLTAGKEYSYQYLINGNLKVADPYAEKILDPVNDPYISATTYPGLKAYPTGATTGIVSVLQIAKPAYNWDVNNFSKPDKRNLVVYELLLRDFVASHDWKTLKDSLSYLKKLGINAIELMPFNEFEGNISWGYNPDFYFAPDKYYGPASTLKEFIDSCHKMGIAVIMDIALNHSFGSSPMVQMYWDAANNRPSADNPWFNPVAKHAFNVGYDMNHESAATKYFVSRVVNHWMTDYKIDGFRFDLSKGFTQTQTCDATGGNCNVAAWGAYDQSRINIWKQYYDTMQLKSPGSYAILEHFADNSEEKVLSDYGFMLWGNENYNYNQASMGYSDGWDFSYGIAAQRGWTKPSLVTYMESHDEERLMFKNLAYGNSSGTYNIKDTATALKRQQLDAAFFFMLPGPKMVWQFGELGYDYSINYCQNGTISNACRTDPKPIRWDYLQQANRKKVFDVYSSLIKLRFNPLLVNDFVSNTSQQSLSSAFKWIKLNDVVVIGNFDVVTTTGSVVFPSSGNWYDYFNGNTITATGASQTFSLAPGEYHIFTKVNAALPVTLLDFSGKRAGNKNVLTWSVNAEQNLSSYELQKSSDGQNFSFVTSIKAQANKNYTFSDNSESSSVEFYRLKMIDNDGNFRFSSIVKIENTDNIRSVSINPNPFTADLKIVITSAVPEKMQLIVSDMSGRKLFKTDADIIAGKNTILIPGSSSLSKGAYLLSVISSEKNENIKVLKSE